MADTNGTNGQHPTAGLPLHLLSALGQRTSLAHRLGNLFAGDRPIHALLGYKPVLQYADFKARYLRQDLAHRIVRAYPEATWSQPPSVKEDDEDEIETPFEAAWEGLVKRLNIYATLERLDILANLGSYAVLLIGLRGQTQLEQPARPVRSPDDVLYLTPYSEEWATIERFEGNPGVATFGQPLLYRLNFGRGNERGKAALPVSHGLVHASRIIHVAEDILDDEVYGIARLEPVFDRLDDLMKIVGGGGEQFWQDAKRRLIFSLRDDFEMAPGDEAALTEEVEEFMHEMRNFVRVKGIDVTALNGQVASPEHHVGVVLDVICATIGIPKRILMGSERGELASGQDAEAWLQRVTRRQKQFAEWRILRPLLDRLLFVGALPEPAQEYQITWDNLLSLSEEQQAGIAEKVAMALDKFAGAGMAQSIVTPQEFRSEFLGLTPEPEGGFLDLEPDEDLSEGKNSDEEDKEADDEGDTSDSEESGDADEDD